ncbi:TonB-dependent receptor [Parapedobacter sp. ISTM3]|uniref:SusC/RagA family TonB-linked outer membrane protein n=1 Tax=Parapedobacter sp. ISTM3 TaxID=2800130 RepID=UPI00190677A2|nr:TonB-dependent receptor [Parapedobacter sp. ISTM3]MBK1441631.1 TonB-dependent receptor [Parapedobacter sp. ISTM3]
MSKHFTSLFLLFFFLSNAVFAQERTVVGNVIAENDGLPLPGVSVTVKGSPNLGTKTDENGGFAMQVPNGATTLIFRYIGFLEKEVAVGSDPLTVSMQDDAQQLSEVIVTGYNTQNRREVAGSISTVQAKDFELVPIGSFDQSIQGRVPGVLIQANSGQPGAAASILIRGKGSVLGSNDPLFIMDGVEITANDFSSLNQADFESISVLKDASATAQYGSRGANGVVLITTKQGKAGRTRIDYNVQYGGSTIPENRLRVMSTDQKLDFELLSGNPYEWTDAELAELRQINTDWEKVFFRTGRTANHTLSASGGTDNTTYFLSGSIFDQTGTVRNTGLKRYTGRVNVSSTAGAFNFGLNSTFGYSEYHNTSENNTSIASPLNAIRWSNPYETPYDAEGNYTQLVSGQPNALSELLENRDARQQLKGVGNVYVEYRAPFLEGLTARTSWGGDFRSNETAAYTSPDTYSGSFDVGGQGSLFRELDRYFRYTGTTSVGYGKTVSEDHTFAVTLYNEIINNTLRSFEFTGYGLGGAFDNEAGITPGNAENGFIPDVGGNGSANALLSYFADIKYSYKNRYYLDITGRRDGSSRFGADRKWANFGSVGFSWIVSDEAFMEPLKPIFNNLKYKISYGSAGNQAGIEDFQSRELYARAVYAGVGGLVQDQLANPLLQWERKSTFNTGVEFNTLGGRLGATIEYYNSITSDLFLNQQLSRTTGFTSLTANIGELQNSGVEVFLDGNLIRTKDFVWGLNLSFTYNKNKVRKLIGDQQEIISTITINRVGESINSIYVVPYAGVNPDNGNPLYIDLEGNVTEDYSPSFRRIVGSYEAPYFGGFGTSLSYKGFSADVFFSFITGHSIFNNDRANVENPNYVSDNLAAVMSTAWKQPGDQTQIPRVDYPFFRSSTSHFVEDGDFLRLRNVNLSYTLPRQWLDKIGVSNIRLFAQGQNLVTWTDFQGFDPEMARGTLNGAQYPALRTYTFGLNVGF